MSTGNGHKPSEDLFHGHGGFPAFDCLCDNRVLCHAGGSERLTPKCQACGGYTSEARYLGYDRRPFACGWKQGLVAPNQVEVSPPPDEYTYEARMRKRDEFDHGPGRNVPLYWTPLAIRKFRFALTPKQRRAQAVELARLRIPAQIRTRRAAFRGKASVEARPFFRRAFLTSFVAWKVRRELELAGEEEREYAKRYPLEAAILGKLQRLCGMLDVARTHRTKEL